MSKKGQLNNFSYKDALAQPLKLKESLKIRDGLGGHVAHSVQWPQIEANLLTGPGFGNFWVSHN